MSLPAVRVHALGCGVGSLQRSLIIHRPSLFHGKTLDIGHCGEVAVLTRRRVSPSQDYHPGVIHAGNKGLAALLTSRGGG